MTAVVVWMCPPGQERDGDNGDNGCGPGSRGGGRWAAMRRRRRPPEAAARNRVPLEGGVGGLGREARAGGGGGGAAGRARRRTRGPARQACPTAKPAGLARRDDLQAEGLGRTSAARPSSRQPWKSCRSGTADRGDALSGVSAVTVPTAGGGSP